MDKYQNRKEAGKVLADELTSYTKRRDAIVLALPRGGVPVAFEVAKKLQLPLDVFIVRKLGVPWHSELAMGALASDDVYIFNENILRELGISASDMEAVIAKEKEELKRREKRYRGHHEPLVLKDKIIILVDDGIATGATIRAAIKALKQQNPAHLIVAVPVADNEICKEIAELCDQLICPLRPSAFYAVGAWYDDFSQTEDDEVYTLLNAAKKFHAQS